MEAKFGLGHSRVFLRAEATRALVQKRFGSFDGPNGFLARWEELAAERAGFPDEPDRGTVYDWIAKGFRKHPTDKLASEQSYLLGLCATLDVDPLALFDFHRNGYFSRFAKIRIAIQRGATRLGALRPLFELYEPDVEWPSDVIARTYWGRDWSSALFDNAQHYQSHDYAALRVQFHQPVEDSPRAVHIAYRRWDTREIDAMWRYYGTVILHDDTIDLYSEGGVHKKMARLQADTIAFRTYFGGRKVEFKLASLHPFDHTIEFPCNDMSIVGFDW